VTKPETLKDVIEETMRVSGVPYKVPVREKQFGGDHYKRMGIEPWDVVDTWPLEQRIGYYRGGALKYTMRMGQQRRAITRSTEGFALSRKVSRYLEESAR
jgi:hypothetical protein